MQNQLQEEACYPRQNREAFNFHPVTLSPNCETTPMGMNPAAYYPKLEYGNRDYLIAADANSDLCQTNMISKVYDIEGDFFFLFRNFLFITYR